jgi:Disulphide bond corrector protein DsbC
VRVAASLGQQGNRILICAAMLGLSAPASSAAAQDISYSRKQSVTMQPPPIASIYRGHPGTVQLEFRVASGLHINSNQPKEEYLKKTELKLDAPTDITIEKVIYPDGQDRSFPFAPDEPINVYSGDFPIEIVLRPLKSVIAMKYAIHGWLFYQACDNAACYPPKRLPVTFEIKVAKNASENKKRIPPQSPHTHD